MQMALLIAAVIVLFDMMTSVRITQFLYNYDLQIKRKDNALANIVEILNLFMLLSSHS